MTIPPRSWPARACALLIAFVLAGLLSAPAFADASTQATPELARFGRLSAHAALVIDRASGEALLDKNSAKVLPIASITKLMVALVVLDSGTKLKSGSAKSCPDFFHFPMKREWQASKVVQHGIDKSRGMWG